MSRVLCLALTLAAARPASAETVPITDIGRFQTASMTRALAINAGGQVAGEYLFSGQSRGGFSWQGGTPVDLGSLGGPITRVWDINDAGVIVGMSSTADGKARAFRWKDGVLADVGLLPGSTDCVAVDVNNRGQILGFCWWGGSVKRAFIWDQGTMTDLGSLGGAYTDPLALNELGQAIGTATVANGLPHGFLWSDGVMTDLLTPWGGYAYAAAVNDHGQVAVLANDGTGRTRAYLWEQGTYTDLGTLGGAGIAVRDMNNAGQIVGYSTTAAGQSHAFLWENGSMTDLGTLGGTSSDAVAINEAGTIAGTAFLPGAIYWTPVSWVDGAIRELPSINGGNCYVEDLNEAGQACGSCYVDGNAYEYHAVVWGAVAPNQPPVAEAGPAQTVRPGTIVTLDGTASYDPDRNAPLAYRWEIVSRPAGSAAALSDPAAVAPAFVADALGDFVVRLVVTDGRGAESLADEVVVSTFNSAPVADAGPDQAIVLAGGTVELDGGRSYDEDGDELEFSWTVASAPSGSLALLEGAGTSRARFVADAYGTYELSLVVRDAWSASAPDIVVVSFENVRPVADPGGNQAALAGVPVTLDGRGSFDANGDPLTYAWHLVSFPEGSGAVPADPAAAVTTFTPDLPGTYVVSLTVSDGLLVSAPGNAEVVATSLQSALLDALRQLVAVINLQPEGSFRNPNLRHALTNKVNAVIQMAADGRYAEAREKLLNDVAPKADGCLADGVPDRTDWIEDCASQAAVAGQVDAVLELLAALL